MQFKPKNLDYLRTAGLNFLFILIIPLILACFIYESILTWIGYILLYSLLESIIDARHYEKELWQDVTFLKVFGITVLFNSLLVVGVSAAIDLFLFEYGIGIAGFLAVLWILLLSKVELIIDNYLLKD